MDCPSSVMPRGYPPTSEIIQRATDIADNNLPHHGGWYLWGALNALPESPSWERYSDNVRLGFAENQLQNPLLSAEQKIGVFAAVLTREPTAYFADHVATDGKEVSHARGDHNQEEIGLGLLKFAANCFERVVSSYTVDEPLENRFRVIAEDYARVAALQDEAGSKSDAAATALMVAPHLLALYESSVALGKHKHQFLDSELRSMALHVGYSDPATLKNILTVLPDNLSENVTKTLDDKRTSELIVLSSETDVDMLLRTFGNDEPSFDFWHGLLRLTQDETKPDDVEHAGMLISHVDEVFPNLFDRANELMLSMTPAEIILFLTGRDDLLAKYYRSIVGAQSVHMMSRFAGECGYSDDIPRFETMVKQVGLSPEQAKTLYDKYFEPQRDEAATDADKKGR